MKVVVFGAGGFGRKYIERCPPGTEIVAVCDNRWKNIAPIFGHRISDPKIIQTLCFDCVMIAIDESSNTGFRFILEIKNELLCMGIPEDKMLLMSADNAQDNKVAFPRVQFLSDLAELFSQYGVNGSIAECGVFRGDFALKMQEFFPDKTLYLFDTFSGFDKRDMNCADETMDSDTIRQTAKHHSQVDQDVLMLKFKHKDKVILKQGYVPETFAGLDKERFLFVNLDMDLYRPTIAALRFFQDKMVDGGVILVHDYFIYKDAPHYWGARKAVDDFSVERPITKLPIGDNRSIAIVL